MSVPEAGDVMGTSLVSLRTCLAGRAPFYYALRLAARRVRGRHRIPVIHALTMRNHPRRSVGMRTAATTRCIIASATLVVVVVPAESGRLNEASKTAIAMPVQIVRARA